MTKCRPRVQRRVQLDRRSFMQLGAGAGLALASTTSNGWSQEAKPLPTLGMVSFPLGNSAHSKIWIRNRKLDEKHGWRLDWQVRSTVESYYGDFNSGVYSSMDIAGLNVLANLYNKGVPFKLVQATFSSIVPLVARNGVKVHAASDLKGKRIGTDKTSFMFAYLRAYLQANGMDVDKDVEIVNVNIVQAIPRLQRGDFDLATAQLELVLLAQKSAPNDLTIVADLQTEFASTISANRAYLYQAVRTDWLTANPGIIERVIPSYRDMAEFVKANMAEAVDLLVPAPDKGGAGLQKDIGMLGYSTGVLGGIKNVWVSLPVQQIKLQIRAELEFYKAIGFIEKVPDDGFFYNG